MAKNDQLLDLLKDLQLSFASHSQSSTQADLRQLFDQPSTDDWDNSGLHFTLELKIHEIDSLLSLLQDVASRPVRQRQSWLTDNQWLLSHLDQLVFSHMRWSMLGAGSDQQTAALALALAKKIKSALTLMSGLQV